MFVSSEPNLLYSLLNKSNADGRRNFKQRRKIGINECWGPRCIPLELKNSRRRWRLCQNRRKRNKSDAKWKYSSWCVLYHPSLGKVKTFARVRDRKKNISLGIQFCNLSDFISISNRTVREGRRKKSPHPLSHPLRILTQFPYIYAIRRSQQFQPLMRSFLFCIKYN